MSVIKLSQMDKQWFDSSSQLGGDREHGKMRGKIAERRLGAGEVHLVDDDSAGPRREAGLVAVEFGAQIVELGGELTEGGVEDVEETETAFDVAEEGDAQSLVPVGAHEQSRNVCDCKWARNQHTVRPVLSFPRRSANTFPFIHTHSETNRLNNFIKHVYIKIKTVPANCSKSS